MAGLTIATIDFEVRSFEEVEPRIRGEITPSFNNTLRSSISSQKRNFRGVTASFNKTKYDAIVAAIANGATVTVTGSVLLGASLSCKVTATYALTGIATVDAGYNHIYVASFTIAQV